MRLHITDISDITEDMFNTGKMLVPEYRQEKIDRYQYMEDKRRSLVAGLLLNYATKDYEAGNYIAHNYITGNCVDKNYLIEASKRERENIHAGHLWESNSEYDIDINKLISGYDKAYDYDIKLTANNKPEYADKNIHFNLSHTGDYVVSILIVSPWLTNNGTKILAPVSRIAGFVAPVAVSPLTPGSDSVI